MLTLLDIIFAIVSGGILWFSFSWSPYGHQELPMTERIAKLTKRTVDAAEPEAELYTKSQRA